VKIRPATKEDIESFADLPVSPSMKAWAAEIDGRVAGLAGFAFAKGRWIAFCDLTQEARAHKTAIGRATVRAFREARAQGIKFIYAQLDEDEPTAHRWLTSLGFELDPRSAYLYRWKE
jgi:N-acetylglutamate synthase-like GNAT family acetyltransferase